MNKLDWMGRKVAVTQRFMRRVYDRRRYFQRKAWIVTPIKRRVGWIVGFRTIYDGYRDFEDEWGYYWQPLDHHDAVQVAFWPTHNPIYVPWDGIEPAREDEEPVAVLDQQRLDMLRVDATAWPRDEKGRWIAWDEATPQQKEECRLKLKELRGSSS